MPLRFWAYQREQETRVWPWTLPDRNHQRAADHWDDSPLVLSELDFTADPKISAAYLLNDMCLSLVTRQVNNRGPSKITCDLLLLEPVKVWKRRWILWRCSSRVLFKQTRRIYDLGERLLGYKMHLLLQSDDKHERKFAETQTRTTDALMFHQKLLVIFIKRSVSCISAPSAQCSGFSLHLLALICAQRVSLKGQSHTLGVTLVVFLSSKN